MIKRAFPLVLGLLTMWLSAFGQQTPERSAWVGNKNAMQKELHTPIESDVASALGLARSDVFATVDGSILIHSLPVLSLLDGRRPPISALGAMGRTPLDFVPLALLNRVDGPRIAAPLYESDAPDGIVDLRSNRMWSSGEVGYSYGKSTGKHGGEATAAYMIGTVGNDKVQITAGVSYEESNVRFPRYTR
jgi:hypothetical protein